MHGCCRPLCRSAYDGSEKDVGQLVEPHLEGDDVGGDDAGVGTVHRDALPCRQLCELAREHRQRELRV